MSNVFIRHKREDDEIIEYEGGVKFNLTHYKRVTFFRENNDYPIHPLIGKTIRQISKIWNKETILYVKTDTLYGDVVITAFTDKMIKNHSASHSDVAFINNRIIVNAYEPKDRDTFEQVYEFRKKFEIV